LPGRFGWSVLTLAWIVTFVISGAGAMFVLFIVVLVSAAGWAIPGIHIVDICL
jgi:hypothetical protein